MGVFFRGASLWPLTSDGTNVTLASGQLRLPDGTAAVPSLAGATSTSSGLHWSSTDPGVTVVSDSGADAVAFSSGGLRLTPTGVVRWGATGTIVGGGFAPDLVLARDAPNTLAQRNGTNAQVFNVYNTYTDVGNYERLAIGYVANTAKIVHQNAGTGAARALRIETNSGILQLSDGSSDLIIGAVTLNVGNRGIIFNTDNTYDVGANGASRPRTIYAGTSVVSPVLSIPSGGSTIISTGVGSVKMSTVNAATNAAWIPITYNGTVYFVPAWATNAP